MKRRGRLAAAGTATVLAAAAGGAIVIRGGDGGAAAERFAPAGATAPVTRGDLIDTKSVDGTLTYAGRRKVGGAASGIITSMPRPGRVIEQGDALYRVDRRPVTLMYGRVPLYRTLRAGIDNGPDVEQLERALRDLGHGAGMTVDRRFSAATARAVRRWQESAGLPATGAVDAAQVVFLPSAVRVAAAKAAVGDRADGGRTALEVTGTERVVHVDLKVTDQALARTGAKVTVEMPDGGAVRGRIAGVGAVAEAGKSQDDETSGKPPTIDVEIELSGAAGRLDRAPVTVTLESARRGRVLTVPVEALLALRGGGPGVEVYGPDGARRAVPVRTGAYGGGRVEISGPGVAEGVRVGVPAP